MVRTGGVAHCPATGCRRLAHAGRSCRHILCCRERVALLQADIDEQRASAQMPACVCRTDLKEPCTNTRTGIPSRHNASGPSTQEAWAAATASAATSMLNVAISKLCFASMRRITLALRSESHAERAALCRLAQLYRACVFGQGRSFRRSKSCRHSKFAPLAATRPRWHHLEAHQVAHIDRQLDVVIDGHTAVPVGGAIPASSTRPRRLGCVLLVVPSGR